MMEFTEHVKEACAIDPKDFVSVKKEAAKEFEARKIYSFTFFATSSREKPPETEEPPAKKVEGFASLEGFADFGDIAGLKPEGETGEDQDAEEEEKKEIKETFKVGFYYHYNNAQHRIYTKRWRSS